MSKKIEKVTDATVSELMTCKRDIDRFIDRECGGDLRNAYWSIKEDGYRTEAENRPDGTVRYLSRARKPFPNFDIFDDYMLTLSAMAGKMFNVGASFDGEVDAKPQNGKVRDFELLQANVFREDNPDKSVFRFKIFDIICDGYTLTQRYAMLCALMAACPPPENVMLVQHHQFFHNDKDWLEYFVKTVVAAGYEGLVLKVKDSLYQTKRSFDWCKCTPLRPADIRVVGMKEGEGKHAGMLGAFICEFEDEDGKTIGSDCGTGMTDEQRAQFWQEGEANIGRIIQVTYRERTKSGALRFAAFAHFRDDKDTTSIY